MEDEYPCIICLIGLPTLLAGEVAHNRADIVDVGSSCDDCFGTSSSHGRDEDEVTVYDGTNDVARLVPCGHQFHSSCLKMWSEQATSCPTCRTNFNKVEILHKVDGDALSSYTVETKVQAADLDMSFDPDPFTDEFIFDPDCLCLICDLGTRPEELMLCEVCDAPYHASCLGLDGVPVDEWLCPSCSPASSNPFEPQTSRTLSRSRRPRRTTTSRATSSSQSTRSSRVSRTSPRNRQWGRAWQAILNRLNQDPGRELVVVESANRPSTRRSGSVPSRRRSQRETIEWREWNTRLRVAEATQGAAYFRTTSSLFFDQDPEETPDMVESWSMRDEALKIEGNSSDQSRISNPVKISSPLNTGDDESHESGRKFKRPRAQLRRSDAAQEHELQHSVLVGQSSEGPSLMRSLLDDIRRPSSTMLNGHSIPGALSGGANRQILNEVSSPGRSTTGGPKCLSPLSLRSPSLSPILIPSLSTTPTPPAEPISPVEIGSPIVSPSGDLSSQKAGQLSPTLEISPEPDIMRVGDQLSLEEKTDIQGLVRNILRPFYRSGTIDKDEYTEINKKVSHLLYDLALDELRDRGLDSREQSQDRRDRMMTVAQANVQILVDRKKS
ncbi:uncharacterized protein V1516DRAFT_674882 [Lipomyces oligophaga]|uniref:uncharacterized protein n=1 Tax=Lipomyces oligophaga TaxID=45792 RepID=UPI0034D01175